MKTLCVFTNAPGEINYWVKPLLSTLSHLHPNIIVDVFLTPCPYASGQEQNILASLPNVKHIYPFSFTKKFNYEKSSTAILFLGGDPFYSLFFAFRHRLKRYAYSEKRKHPFFTHVFYRDKIGDLMASAMTPLPELDKSILQKKLGITKQKYAVFLPGSRLRMIRSGIPYFSDIVAHIQKNHPDFKAVLLVSSFITDEQLSPYNLSLFKVIRNTDERYLGLGKLLVTFPGSVTAAAMYLQQPMIMLLPLQSISALTFTGLMSFLMKVPFLKLIIQWLLPKLIQSNKKPYALPNIISHQRIVPEFVGDISAKQAARHISTLFYNDKVLEEQRKKLAGIIPKKKVAEKIIHTIFSPMSSNVTTG